ncbi:MAG: phosphonoacetate hydrolase [Hyphomicrobiaceae bacterium]|nr:phosphonoacetate hydrolase [Hyphomicrobiaceae bacterium]
MPQDTSPRTSKAAGGAGRRAPEVTLNGVRYLWPKQPVVVVCIDGGDPAYFDRALKDGIIPNIARFMKSGFSAVADCVIPSFTCPNNVSIITGAPPSIHGISGNFYLEPETREAVVMTGPELMRSSTILAAFDRVGARVVSITAKDKLRQQLGKDLDIAGGAINFSSEKADKCTLAENGIEDVLGLVGLPLPDMYSGELSLFVLEAGIKLLADRRPDVMYLSLTDFIQHKYAPGEGESDRYYKSMDELIGKLDALGAVVALTADHGMNDKSNPDATPRVVWLQEILDKELGKDSTIVICPITDYFVAHHGSFGGFVRVYCNGKATPQDVIEIARRQPGIEMVCDKETAARVFDLPIDREGDVVVISDVDTCIGMTPAKHDMSGLAGHRLRTHGGLTEGKVPFILNRPLHECYAARAARGGLRNYHIFDFAINGSKV